MKADFTQDRVVGGRLTLRQPRRGHRVGHDAILLAAATSATEGAHAVEFGAGVGAAGLALARRVEGLRVTLVELDAALVEFAAHNARTNGLAQRVRALALDVTAPARAYAANGLAPESADYVLMNPPFNDPARQNVSPDRHRRLAHAASPSTLPAWTKAANRLLRPGGTLFLIFRADGLALVLAALASNFGAIAIRPVHARAAAPAIRILVRARKARRAPLSLCPPLLLAGDDGRATRAADAVLRDGEALAWPE